MRNSPPSTRNILRRSLSAFQKSPKKSDRKEYNVPEINSTTENRDLIEKLTSSLLDSMNEHVPNQSTKFSKASQPVYKILLQEYFTLLNENTLLALFLTFTGILSAIPLMIASTVLVGSIIVCLLFWLWISAIVIIGSAMISAGWVAGIWVLIKSYEMVKFSYHRYQSSKSLAITSENSSLIAGDAATQKFGFSD